MGKGFWILVAVLLALSERSSAADRQDFSTLVTGFVGAWEAGDMDYLDALLDPGIGLWVIEPRGVKRMAVRFDSIEEALALGEDHFGRLGFVGFEGCRPEPGPPPQCRGEGERGPLCHFGEVDPDSLALFEVRLESAGGPVEERRRWQEDWSSVKRSVEGGVYFLSDLEWGAAFYFVRSGDRWRLLIVDTADCSA